MLRASALVALLGLLLVVPGSVRGQETGDLSALRQELEARRAELARQQEQLRRQQEELERQAKELAALAARLDAVSRMPAEAKAPETVPPRDPVGDLNAESVAAGAFPGSIRIPGTRDLSLAIGGFVKLVAIADSDLEATGPTFLPANIGSSRPDTEGGTSFDAALSRLWIDGQAPTSSGNLRGYIEGDLNGRNDGTLSLNLRHAYGTWRAGRTTLTAGHTWSTTMDLKILPEGMTEPTISGAIFTRQPQLRLSHRSPGSFRFDLALEDASSADVTAGGDWRPTTRLPDLVGAAEWDWGKAGHLRATGLVRQVRVTDGQGTSASATGWGLSLGAHVGVGESDKLCFSASLGDGNGRYLLGVPGGQAGFVVGAGGDLRLQRGTGAFVTYRHAWSKAVRSTAGLGGAWIADESWQAADAFDRSTFALLNLIWSPLHYVTVGTEVQYGRRETKNGSVKDNTRLILGIQLF